ncbi:hypothetical protein AA0473_1995 [Acetobacter orleanensis NRIC 0473]|uniref:DUF4232 domain-containing protein n=2 Tax=Acetobacter orleanensis TaxID=104099 RepID=A0A4Y3TPS0_9PROT|nr:hypothetical protein Abol_027_029 [Acetobacter orleanensis JCM 7639]GBR29359.1 hypothetical protein AA0473_1995 [Acetobacter orleanensis NRIC 0473]GEB83764.1 hypothetical protein AOR01nite_22410 [Acetobacter orleanensis]
MVGAGVAALLFSTPVFAAESTDTLPSAAETAIMTRQIAAIKNPQERAAVQSQSLAWKMTTFLCQKAAHAPLKRLGAGSRFFLQDDKPDSQVLVSASLVKGRGQFRRPDGMNWTAFSWSCHLDPATGRVKKFEARPTAAASVAVTGADAMPERSTREIPACLASNLDIKLDDRNGAFDGTSQSGTVLVVRNTGPDACAMPPVPHVQFEDKAGQKLSVISRPVVQARQTSPDNGKAQQHVEAVILPPGAEREETLHWVSGEVYDDSHNCVRPARLVLTIGQSEKKVAFKGQMCAPAKASQVFDQSPLQAHTDAQ